MRPQGSLRDPGGVPRAVKLSSRLYEVPVSDYETWKTMREDLRKIPGVIKVSESNHTATALNRI